MQHDNGGAKACRQCIIDGMDTFARALKVAIRILQESALPRHKAAKFRCFGSGDGAAFERGERDLVALRNLADGGGELAHRSGKQEWYENRINQYM